MSASTAMSRMPAAANPRRLNTLAAARRISTRRRSARRSARFERLFENRTRFNSTADVGADTCFPPPSQTGIGLRRGTPERETRRRRGRRDPARRARTNRPAPGRPRSARCAGAGSIQTDEVAVVVLDALAAAWLWRPSSGGASGGRLPSGSCDLLARLGRRVRYCKTPSNSHPDVAGGSGHACRLESWIASGPSVEDEEHQGSVQDRGEARRGRDGRGVSRLRSAADGSRSGGQDAARVRGPLGARSLLQGVQRPQVDQPPEHRRDLRHGRVRGRGRARSRFSSCRCCAARRSTP